MTDLGQKKLPLENLHQAAGARFGPFAGWSMPLQYPAGVMKEHLHTREHAGLFDISHMKLFTVSGPGAAALLSKACPLGAEALAERQSKYTFFLTETAGIIDDLIVTRLGPTRFMVVANAGNAAEDEAHLKALAQDFDCTVTPLDRVFLAIQGPEAEAVLKSAGVDGSHLGFMTGFEPRENWFMSRSGYTGEDGFEIGLPEADARELAAKLLSDERLIWIGLAARDSLRLEAGLCLHGQDISKDSDPVSAGLALGDPETAQDRRNLCWRRIAAQEDRARRRRKARRPQTRRKAASTSRRSIDGRDRRGGRPRHFRRLRPIGRPSGRHGLRRGPTRQTRHPNLRRRARRESVRRRPFPTLHPTSLPQRMNPMPQIFYTEDHEWIRVEGDTATVGITNYAQEQLGDLVFVELPEAGKKVKKGDVAVVVESVKAASDVYAPVDGEIVDANGALSSEPALVNSSPAGDGWLWKMKLADKTQLEGLMDEAAYKKHIG